MIMISTLIAKILFPVIKKLAILYCQACQKDITCTISYRDDGIRYEI